MLMNSQTTLRDHSIPSGNRFLEYLLELVCCVRLRRVSVHHERLSKRLEHHLRIFHVRLDRLKDGVGLLDLGHGVCHKLLDRMALPVQMLQALLQDLIDVIELCLQERPLNLQKRGQHIIVHIHNQLKVPRLLPIRLILRKDLLCRVGDLDFQHLKVLHLPEQADQGGVEVDAEEGRVSLAPAEQVLLQLLYPRVLLLKAPVIDVRGLILLEAGHDRQVRAHNLLALLALQHRLADPLEPGHRLLHALHQPAAPKHRARVRRRVVGDGGVLLARDEDLLHRLEVARVGAEQVRVLALEVGEDDLALQEALKRVEELEAAEHRRAVVEGLHDDGGQPPLEFVDGAAEGVEVVVEALVLHVHDVLGRLPEHRAGVDELVEDLLHVGRERLALGPADLDPLELAELDDGLHQVEHVVAPLEEAVQAGEERAVLEAPRVGRALGAGAGLVVEVGALEGDRHAQADLERVDRVLRLHLEELLAADEAGGLADQIVADFAHEDDEAARGVVELGVLPDEEDGVHQRLEHGGDVGEGLAREHLQELGHRVEVDHVVVGLHPRLRHLLAEAVECRKVGRLGDFEKPDDLLHLVAAQLLVDRIQIFCFLGPKIQLGLRARVVPALENILRIELEHVFDLVCPGDN
mmetsp:Transcript_52159/g.108898  ORF Transcript_52159/g.108898 Transcript_52159/m.108898 type:complete len:636 (-) Transcript_52159:578-2485(-)